MKSNNFCALVSIPRSMMTRRTGASSHQSSISQMSVEETLNTLNNQVIIIITLFINWREITLDAVILQAVAVYKLLFFSHFPLLQGLWVHLSETEEQELARLCIICRCIRTPQMARLWISYYHSFSYLESHQEAGCFFSICDVWTCEFIVTSLFKMED